MLVVEMKNTLALVSVLTILIPDACCYICPKSETKCETSLVIEHHLTMMHENKALYPSAGKLYYYDVTNTSAADPVNADEVITADGWEMTRLVIVANGSLPGPDIIVYEGQTITVHVTNHLFSDTVAIHWHGITQKGTPYMDGAAFITQCPILPYQTFTYTFKAEPKGTHWYHSHVGSQRAKGLHGAFIVRPKEETDFEERIMSVQDWNHDWDDDMGQTKMALGFFRNKIPFINSIGLDGNIFSFFLMQSGLINGKGRYHDPKTGNHNEAPISVFDVTSNKKYRFRVIGSGTLYPFRLSIDQHKMELVASDGFDLETEVIESFIINPGERFDIIITANQTVGNYWIRAQTLEVDHDHHVEAILRYKGAPEEEPTTSRQSCNTERCRVANCPFSFYPKNSNTDCIMFGQLKAKAEDDPAPQRIEGKFQQFFMNFGIRPYSAGTLLSSINGRVFIPPGISAMSQPKELSNSCDHADCGEQKSCKCTNSVNLAHGNTVEIILTNMGMPPLTGHPIHMHGYSFYVLKMGYATYNETTGKFIHGNMDIDCRGGVDRKDSFCNDPTWSNQTWLDGDIPGLELERPPKKDTLIVPVGAYAVIRIVADNPGVWLLHCHIKVHNTDGMVVMLNDSFSRHPSPPNNFPICYDFPRKFSMPTTSTAAPTAATTCTGEYSSSSFWTAVGLLIAIGVIEFLVVVYMCCRASRRKDGNDFEPTTNATKYAYANKATT